ncbi:hypothetical protein L7F22_042968 [Adiantum nelumboides]|nr:hypothetical protein [Adiantum nelumboides]
MDSSKSTSALEIVTSSTSQLPSENIPKNLREAKGFVQKLPSTLSSSNGKEKSLMNVDLRKPMKKILGSSHQQILKRAIEAKHVGKQFSSTLSKKHILKLLKELQETSIRAEVKHTTSVDTIADLIYSMEMEGGCLWKVQDEVSTMKNETLKSVSNRQVRISYIQATQNKVLRILEELQSQKKEHATALQSIVFDVRTATNKLSAIAKVQSSSIGEKPSLSNSKKRRRWLCEQLGLIARCKRDSNFLNLSKEEMQAIKRHNEILAMKKEAHFRNMFSSYITGIIGDEGIMKEMNELVAKQDHMLANKKMSLHQRWHEQVFKNINEQVASKLKLLTPDQIKDKIRYFHYQYVNASNQRLLFLDIIDNTFYNPFESLRYSVKYNSNFGDPLKRDVENNIPPRQVSTESDSVEETEIVQQFQEEQTDINTTKVDTEAVLSLCTIFKKSSRACTPKGPNAWCGADRRHDEHSDETNDVQNDDDDEKGDDDEDQDKDEGPSAQGHDSGDDDDDRSDEEDGSQVIVKDLEKWYSHDVLHNMKIDVPKPSDEAPLRGKRTKQHEMCSFLERFQDEATKQFSLCLRDHKQSVEALKEQVSLLGSEVVTLKMAINRLNAIDKRRSHMVMPATQPK